MSPQRGSPRTLWITQVNYTLIWNSCLINNMLSSAYSKTCLWCHLQKPNSQRSSCTRRYPRYDRAHFYDLHISHVNEKFLIASFFLQANVICIVYSVNNKKSIEKVSMFSLCLHCRLLNPWQQKKDAVDFGQLISLNWGFWLSRVFDHYHYCPRWPATGSPSLMTGQTRIAGLLMYWHVY